MTEWHVQHEEVIQHQTERINDQEQILSTLNTQLADEQQNNLDLVGKLNNREQDVQILNNQLKGFEKLNININKELKYPKKYFKNPAGRNKGPSRKKF